MAITPDRVMTEEKMDCILNRRSQGRLQGRIGAISFSAGQSLHLNRFWREGLRRTLCLGGRTVPHPGRHEHGEIMDE